MVSEPNVAILIDYENVGLGNLQTLFDQASNTGRIIVKRAYADWSAVNKTARDQLLELGIEPVQQFHASGSKNASDIRLAIDAVELLVHSPVDTFVIVSADSDFVPLVMKLRAAGKGVIGAGRQAVVSHTLVKSCDRYIFLDKQEKSQKAEKEALPTEASELLIRALEASADEEGKAVGATLHNTMRRIDPGFDFKSLGYSTFTRFLESCDQVQVQRPKGRRGDVVVQRIR